MDGFHFNQTLFEEALKDPVKKALIIKLISDEKETIKRYKAEHKLGNVTPSPLKKVKQKIGYESPTALLRRRALEKQNRPKSTTSDSISEASTESKSTRCYSPIPYNSLLSGIIAYVEIRRNNKDQSAGAKALMKSMGAIVKEHFEQDVTHVIFKDGTYPTYLKAKLMKVHLVSVLWLEAVRRNNEKVSEQNYPALGTENYGNNISVVCSQMEREYKEVVREEVRRSLDAGNPLPSTKCLRRNKRNTISSSSQCFSSNSQYLSPQYDNESFEDDEVGTILRKMEDNRKRVGSSSSYILGTISPLLTSDDSDCGMVDGEFNHLGSEDSHIPGCIKLNRVTPPKSVTRNNSKNMELTCVYESDCDSNESRSLINSHIMISNGNKNSRNMDFTNISNKDYLLKPDEYLSVPKNSQNFRNSDEKNSIHSNLEANHVTNIIHSQSEIHRPPNYKLHRKRKKSSKENLDGGDALKSMENLPKPHLTKSSGETSPDEILHKKTDLRISSTCSRKSLRKSKILCENKNNVNLNQNIMNINNNGDSDKSSKLFTNVQGSVKRTNKLSRGDETDCLFDVQSWIEHNCSFRNDIFPGADLTKEKLTNLSSLHISNISEEVVKSLVDKEICEYNVIPKIVITDNSNNFDRKCENRIKVNENGSTSDQKCLKAKIDTESTIDFERIYIDERCRKSNFLRKSCRERENLNAEYVDSSSKYFNNSRNNINNEMRTKISRLNEVAKETNKMSTPLDDAKVASDDALQFEDISKSKPKVLLITGEILTQTHTAKCLNGESDGLKTKRATRKSPRKNRVLNISVESSILKETVLKPLRKSQKIINQSKEVMSHSETSNNSKSVKEESEDTDMETATYERTEVFLGGLTNLENKNSMKLVRQSLWKSLKEDCNTNRSVETIMSPLKFSNDLKEIARESSGKIQYYSEDDILKTSVNSLRESESPKQIVAINLRRKSLRNSRKSHTKYCEEIMRDVDNSNSKMAVCSLRRSLRNLSGGDTSTNRSAESTMSPLQISNVSKQLKEKLEHGNEGTIETVSLERLKKSLDNSSNSMHKLIMKPELRKSDTSTIQSEETTMSSLQISNDSNKCKSKSKNKNEGNIEADTLEEPGGPAVELSTSDHRLTKMPVRKSWKSDTSTNQTAETTMSSLRISNDSKRKSKNGNEGTTEVDTSKNSEEPAGELSTSENMMNNKQIRKTTNLSVETTMSSLQITVNSNISEDEAIGKNSGSVGIILNQLNQFSQKIHKSHLEKPIRKSLRISHKKNNSSITQSAEITMSSSEIAEDSDATGESKNLIWSTEKNYNSKRNKKIRKLYNPDDPVQPILNCNTSDEIERVNLRQLKVKRSKPVDNNVLVHSNVLLNAKAQEYLEKRDKMLRIESESEDELELKSDHPSLENELGETSHQMNIKRKKLELKTSIKPINRDSDEQKELANLILHKKGANSFFKTPIAVKKSNSSTRRNRNCLTQEDILIVTPVHKQRRSSLDFQPRSNSSSKSKMKTEKIPSIVCTKMHKTDVQMFSKIVNKLGKFLIEDKVTSRTTHLVVGEAKRTINMLRAIARGCWILRQEWLLRSLEENKWLPEEDYEATEFSSTVLKCRLEREAFGPSFTLDIFNNCGLIYVAKHTTPRCSDLRELINLCGGNVAKISDNAAIVIGGYFENILCVNEFWILDSITYGRKKPFKRYVIKNRRDHCKILKSPYF